MISKISFTLSPRDKLWNSHHSHQIRVRILEFWVFSACKIVCLDQLVIKPVGLIDGNDYSWNDGGIFDCMLHEMMRKRNEK